MAGKKGQPDQGKVPPGNNQQGRQPGHNTGKEAWKNNVKLQTRNDPGIPKTTGPEPKEVDIGKEKQKK